MYRQLHSVPAIIMKRYQSFTLKQFLLFGTATKFNGLIFDVENEIDRVLCLASSISADTDESETDSSKIWM